jgi:hypothetical protein
MEAGVKMIKVKTTRSKPKTWTAKGGEGITFTGDEEFQAEEKERKQGERR